MTKRVIDFPAWLGDRVRHIESVLDQFLPPASRLPAELHEAMRYAVLGGGKRVRAALVYAAGEASLPSGTAASPQHIALDHAAAAVELIHAYSLVHDDLPCMDDDALRRGRPTVHVRYGEATAMLAGDALQPLAFELLGMMPIAPALIVQATQLLARSAGSLGMVGGQAIDCASVGVRLTADDLRQMHSMKTGAMLEASVLLGGIVAGAGSAARQGLEKYAAAIGLAFQVVDDILDVTADTATLGKTAGKDAAADKPTYVSTLGLEGSRALLRQLHEDAHAALLPLGPPAAHLACIADYIVGRDR
ncbi:geranyl transferase [Pusillimonas sp. TS35]|uniref:polyprenyl synthetase family protein n=1 Tax=Paracandidimonas lactea TaxID=2895524 RepID=UPI00136AF364|nr:farnesyl diphosphate synthase [Paracandidimonas lactea]MYN13812.1 geranyl transferase [Pusillimonas sp. TS35]